MIHRSQFHIFWAIRVPNFAVSPPRPEVPSFFPLLATKWRGKRGPGPHGLDLSLRIVLAEPVSLSAMILTLRSIFHLPVMSWCRRA